MPIIERDQFLGPVGAHPDHHQQAHLVLLEAHLQMDPVDPQVHVVGPGQGALAERGRLVLPVLGQPGDRRRRQAVAGAEELLERRREVARGQPVQVQQRQQLCHPRGLARPGRQDRRGEPRSMPGDRVDALVVDPRCAYRHRPGRGHYLPLAVMPVAHHQPPAVIVDLMCVRVDVGRDLGPQRDREHLPGRVPHQLVQHRRTGRGPAGHVGLERVINYLEQGRTFPNQRANAGPDQRALSSRSSSGRCAPSRHPAEGHPQVLIIAREAEQERSMNFSNCSGSRHSGAGVTLSHWARGSSSRTPGWEGRVVVRRRVLLWRVVVQKGGCRGHETYATADRRAPVSVLVSFST